MTAAQKRRILAERLEEARERAVVSDSAYFFNELTECSRSRLDVAKLSKVAAQVILDAAEVRIACRALELATKTKRKARA